MPYKDKAKQLECQRRYYARNPTVYSAHRSRRKKEMTTLIREMKDNRPCTDCGISYPYYVMEFDHLPGSKKTCHPAELANRGWGLDRVNEELSQCELVCANCHRERTHKRRKKRVHGEMAS